MRIWLYKIVNKKNGKIYIGQTTLGLRRWKTHCTNARVGRDGALSSAIRKYGEKNFTFTLLYAIKSKYVADYCEQGLISKYKSNQTENGYNRTTGGGTRIGTKLSDITRKQLSKNNWMAKGHLGYEHSKERNDKISKALTGRIIPRKIRKKISESTSRAITNKWKDVTYRRKQHKSRVGRLFSKLHRKNLSIAMVGNKNGKRR